MTPAKKTTGKSADQAKVMEAMRELLHNPETPVELWNEVSQFVTTQSNECGDDLYQSPVYLTQILNSVLPEDRMGAVEAARKAEKGGHNGN